MSVCLPVCVFILVCVCDCVLGLAAVALQFKWDYHSVGDTTYDLPSLLASIPREQRESRAAAAVHLPHAPAVYSFHGIYLKIIHRPNLASPYPNTRTIQPQNKPAKYEQITNQNIVFNLQFIFKSYIEIVYI